MNKLAKHEAHAIDVATARELLERSTSIDEVVDLRDKAKAVEVYHRVRRDGSRSEAAAAEIVVRAERRLGEMLREMPDAPRGGDRRSAAAQTKGPVSVPSIQAPKLADLGFTKNESSRFQQLAAIAPVDFERRVKASIDAAKKPRARAMLEDDRRKERLEKIVEISKSNEKLDGSIGLFPVLYADPPWRYEHAVSESRAIENHYPTMTLDDICDLKISDVTTPDAILFLWATSPKLAESMRVIEAWGFNYRTCAVWVKPQLGMGYYFRQKHELLLVATRGAPPAPAVEARHESVIVAPRTTHSAKPVEFYEVIEKMYPELPKLELFCRSPRPGWKAWGNQAGGAAA